MYHARRYSGGSRPSNRGRGAGGGGGATKRGALDVKKNILWPFGPQFGLTKKGGRVPLGRSPGSATEIRKVYDELSVPKTWNYMFT